TRITKQGAVRAAIFRAGVRKRVLALNLRELARLRQPLKQVLADVLHSIRLCLCCAGELVNPDRLRHCAPSASVSTVAHAQRRKHLPGGAAVFPLQLWRKNEAQRRASAKSKFASRHFPRRLWLAKILAMSHQLNRRTFILAGGLTALAST